MDTKPLVSIICVSMNHEKYVENGLQTFIDQDYSNVEILYIDNASTDTTYEIASKIFANCKRPYQSFKRERSYSLPQNFNFLIEKTKGKYLCFISCDDWMKPEYITKMVTEYEQHQHIGLLYSNGWYYYEDKNTYALAANKNFLTGRIFNHIFLKGVIFPIGIMVKKTTLEKVGLFDESIAIEDYDFWLRVSMEFEIGYQNQPLIYYRKHSKSMTGFDGYKYIPMYLKIAEKYKTHPLYKQVCRNHRKHVIMGNISTGEYKKAIILGLKDFRMERFYFSVSLQLVKKFLRIEGRQNP